MSSPSRATAVVAVADRLVAHRYVVLAAGAVYFWLGGLWLGNFGSGDWGYFVGAARSLSHVPDIGVYFGPIALLLAVPFTALSLRTGWIICSGLGMALGVVAIRCLEAAAAASNAAERRLRDRTVLVGGLFALYALSQPGVTAGHVDDVLALAAIAVALRGVASDRWVVASVAVGVAIDCKPWAGLLLPLACAVAGARVRGLLLTLGAAVALLLPFLLIQHGAVNLGSVNLAVEGDSGAHILGAAVGSTPGWPRIAQIAVALPLGGYAVATERFYLVPLIALAIRVNLDPATAAYYAAGPVFGAFVWDVFRPARLPGIRTAAVCLALLVIPKDVNLLHLVRGTSAFVSFAVLRLLVLLGVVSTTLRVAALRRGLGSPR